MTLNLLKDESTNIIKSAEIFHLSPRLLASAIYSDRRMNYNLLDHTLDKAIARKGRDNSIGIAQIRVSTAKWVEQQIHNPKSLYYLGEEFESIIPDSLSRDEIIDTLSDSRQNLLYAAAYTVMIMQRWKKAGFDISDRPEIVATLYNIGPIKKDGSERFPNANPRANEYGYVALDFYQSDLLKDIF
ncbi:MAG: DUF1402 family protein [Actinobacteria bacterium]|nr:DUF1402 family protein [Actinomycetota bacterium]